MNIEIISYMLVSLFYVCPLHIMKEKSGTSTVQVTLMVSGHTDCATLNMQHLFIETCPKTCLKFTKKN